MKATRKGQGEMAKVEKKSSVKTKHELVILPPNLQVGMFMIRGSSPLVMNKFSQKAINQIKKTQEGGSTSKTKKKREPKNFKECYENSRHRGPNGEDGIPCSGIRAAMISACRLAGFVMTRAKMSVFVLPDFFDTTEGTGMVTITKGKPQYVEHWVRNETGVVDLRARAMWSPGWEAKIRIQYDADQFTLEDVANLLMRVGMQVGIMEGRADSKKSAGMGWGNFELCGKEAVNE
jgi:hypothetical protein